MMLESAVMKKAESGSWQQKKICGWFRVVGGDVEQGFA
jgi:hypothetical protein